MILGGYAMLDDRSMPPPDFVFEEILELPQPSRAVKFAARLWARAP